MVTSMIHRRALVGLAFVFGWIGLVPTSTAWSQQLTWAEKMFEKRSHDFGFVARGSETKYRFKITNLYKQKVHITDVRTTCGCSAGTPTKRSLESLESGYIEVTMDTLKFIRRKDTNLIITFDAPLYAEVRIPIKAYIRTDVVLDPGAVNFGAIDQGTKSERRVGIAYAGRSDWHIKAVKTANEHIEAKVVETGRGGGLVNYDLLVTLRSSALPGVIRDRLILITDDINGPEVPILVEGRVEADISVTPAVVSLGMLNPGQVKKFNIVLRGNKPFQILKIECDSEDQAFKDAFRVRLPKTSNKVHVVPLSVTPPDEPGTFNEQFTITIAGRDEPITFKAYGKIASPVQQ